jgi:hypothetical protein
MKLTAADIKLDELAQFTGTQNYHSPLTVFSLLEAITYNLVETSEPSKDGKMEHHSLTPLAAMSDGVMYLAERGMIGAIRSILQCQYKNFIGVSSKEINAFISAKVFTPRFCVPFFSFQKWVFSVKVASFDSNLYNKKLELESHDETCFVSYAYINKDIDIFDLHKSPFLGDKPLTIYVAAGEWYPGRLIPILYLPSEH